MNQEKELKELNELNDGQINYDDFLNYDEDFFSFENESYADIHQTQEFDEMSILAEDTEDDFHLLEDENSNTNVVQEVESFENEEMVENYIDDNVVNEIVDNDKELLNPEQFAQKIKVQKNIPMFSYSSNLFIALVFINAIVFAYTFMNKNYGLATNALFGVIFATVLVIIGNRRIKQALSGEWINNVENPNAPILRAKKVKSNFTLMENIFILMLTPLGWMGMIVVLIIVSRKPGLLKLKNEGYTLYQGKHNCMNKYIFSNGINNGQQVKFNYNYNQIIYEDNNVIIVERS